MRRIIYVVALLLINSHLCFPADNLTDKLDELMNKYDKIGMFSGVVLLAKDGEPVYEKAFGYADWNKKIPNTTETLFNIASIGKMFTHEMILQLEQESKLKTSDPLSKYLTIFPEETGNKITIQMLIDMKAGLGDCLRSPEFLKNFKKYKTVDDFLELIKTQPLLYEPGTSRQYSNSGFIVLGGVIEKVTGKSYAENLKERFFIPLGMNNSYYKQFGDNVSGCASGTRITFTGEKISVPDFGMPSPAGGLFMNAEDLLKFDNEVRKSGLLKLATRAGGTPVWNSILAQYDNGYSLIILSNFGLDAEEVAKRFNYIMKGKEYPEPNVTMNMRLYKILKENGTDELEKKFKDVLKDYNEKYIDVHLNIFGYELMQDGKIDLAIEVFKLNAKLFPKVPNVWDSLGEAYMKNGDKSLAIENYKKVLELEPNNQHAKMMLDKLESQK
jgi:CubicO group peptidase (beta-lactamase class C family)